MKWEVFVIQDEFYRGSEFKETTEYQHFPAECYVKPKEENSVGIEQSDLGKEITTLQTSSRKKSAEKKNGLLDKIFNAIKTCGVAATVAVVAVVGSTMISNAPTAKLVSLTVESTYVEYQLSVEEIDEQNSYAVVVSAANEEVNRFPVEEDGMYENRVDGLKPEWEYTLAFVRTDEFVGETVLLTKTFQTKPPPNYQLSVYDMELAGLNEANVFFTHANLDDNCVSELVISYENGEQTTVTLGIFDLIRGYARVSLDGSFNSMTVTPIVRIANSDNAVEFESYNHTFEQTLKASFVVNTTDKIITFFLDSLASNAKYAHIVNNNSGEEFDEYLAGRFVRCNYNATDDSLASYTIYLTDSEGQRVTNDFSATFDQSLSLEPEFEFSYKNPGEVGITYNEDGTINIYIQTDFQTDDPNLYYQVYLGNYVFKSRDSTFVATGLPNVNYTLIYDIMMDVDGIPYSVYNVYPSGSANELDLGEIVDCELSDNTATLTVPKYYLNNIDLGSVRLQSSSGEKIVVDETSWIYDEIENQYSVVVPFTNDFDYVDVFVTGNQSKQIMEQIPNYVGNVEYEFTNRIYK